MDTINARTHSDTYEYLANQIKRLMNGEELSYDSLELMLFTVEQLSKDAVIPSYPEPQGDIQEEYTITWCIDDVLQERPDLTRTQASEVLYKLCDPAEHDATIGVNWDSINCMCDMLHGEAPEEPQGDPSY